MKNISLKCVLTLILTLNVSLVFGIEYGTDFLEPGNPGGMSVSLKTFDEGWTVNCGTTFDADIWLIDVPEKLITAGFLIDFDESKISVVSAEVYDGSLPGPWDADMTNKVPNPSGPGTYMVIVGNLSSALPDAGDDIPIARIRFACTSTGDAAVTFTTVSDFDTVVGNSSTVYDNQIASKTVIIFRAQGTSTTSSSSTTTTSNTSSSTDSTSTTTAAEQDSDDDGISDDQDNCHKIPNGPDAGTCIWGSKTGDPCSVAGYDPMDCGTNDPFCSMDQEDTDNDGVGNACDNCLRDDNPDQEDADCDGIGDVCDRTPNCTIGVNCDAECDGVYDQIDNCPNTANGPDSGTCTEGDVGVACMSNEECGTNGICSINQEDKDVDGDGDACDTTDNRVILSVSKGFGLPGSTNNAVTIDLDNPNNIVRAVQVDICDVDNYLTCTACEPAGRASDYSCSISDTGCCNVKLENLTSVDASIAKGTGRIFTISYNVSPSAPSDECKEVKPQNEKVTDDNNVALPVKLESGDFCFKTAPITTTSSTTTTTPSVTVVYPEFICQSVWFFLPYLLSIKGNGIVFSSSCMITYEPSQMHFTIGRMSDAYFWDIIFLMPSVLTGPIEEISITMICGKDEADGTLNFISCGSF
jgi:hypothetical protein